MCSFVRGLSQRHLGAYADLTSVVKQHNSSLSIIRHTRRVKKVKIGQFQAFCFNIWKKYNTFQEKNFIWRVDYSDLNQIIYN